MKAFRGQPSIYASDQPLDRRAELEVKKITLNFGGVMALHDVDLTVRTGELVSVIGPNGAGKTTLLRILATLSRPSEGRFEIVGRDGVRERDAVRATIAVLAHSSHLYDELDAIENLRFAMALRGGSPSDRELKLVLDRVAIGAFAMMKVRYYSAGMKKRLAIAKAMLSQPRVLLLDEPYTSLDDAGVDMMNRYIRDSTATGMAVLMTTHDRAKSAAVAHRIGVLDQHGLRELSLDTLKADELR